MNNTQRNSLPSVNDWNFTKCDILDLEFIKHYIHSVNANADTDNIVKAITELHDADKYFLYYYINADK